MRSQYFWRMRSASALRFSNEWSSLNLQRMLALEGFSDAEGVGMTVVVVLVIVVGETSGSLPSASLLLHLRLIAWRCQYWCHCSCLPRSDLEGW